MTKKKLKNNLLSNTKISNKVKLKILKLINLQKYIEDEIKLLDKFFDEKQVVVEMNGYRVNPFNEIKEIFSQSLHRIAKITAEEIVLEEKLRLSEEEAMKLGKEFSHHLDYKYGYNSALSDLQTKIKEFGI